jgi:hypothetical protein
MHSGTRRVHGVEDYQVASSIPAALEADNCDGMTRLLEIDRR